jgi:CRP-like cAMP-binding protein
MAEVNTQVISFLKGTQLCRGLDEAQIVRLAESIVIEDLPVEYSLPVDEEEDYPFYIVTTGKVHLDYQQGKIETIVRIEEDFFGADILFFGKRRLYRVTAVEPTRLLRIEGERLAKFIEEMPQLKENIKDILDFYRLRQNRHFLWLGEEESIQLMRRKHTAALFVSLTLPVMVGWVAAIVFFISTQINSSSFQLVMQWGSVLLLIGAGLWGVWRWFDWRNDWYIVTDQRVVWLERVIGLYDSRVESPLTAIRTTEVSSTFAGRSLGFGDVNVRSLMGQVVFRDVGQPEEVKAVIVEQQYLAGERQETADLDEIERLIRDKIESMTEEDQEEPDSEVPEEEEPTGHRRRLIDYFSTRLVEGDVITYRKHIYVLFRKTWLPGLIILIILGLMVFLYYQVSVSQSGFPTGLTIVLVGAVLLFFPCLWWLYQYVDWRNDIYRITEDKIIHSERKPLGSEITKSALLEDILNLYYVRLGLVGIMFNFGSVIANVGTEAKFVFRGIHDPARAQQDIFNRMFSNRRMKEQLDATLEREKAANWFAAYHRNVLDIQDDENSPNLDQNSR